MQVGHGYTDTRYSILHIGITLLRIISLTSGSFAVGTTNVK